MARGTRCWRTVFIVILISSISPTVALGTACTTPLGPGTASPEDPYWLETIDHQYVRTLSKCKPLVKTIYIEVCLHSMKIVIHTLSFAMSKLTGRWETVSQTIQTRSSWDFISWPFSQVAKLQSNQAVRLKMDIVVDKAVIRRL